MNFLGAFKKEKQAAEKPLPKRGLLTPKTEENLAPENFLPALAKGVRRRVSFWKSWWRYEPEVFFGFDWVADQLRWVQLSKKPKAGAKLGWKWELADFGIQDLAPTPDFDEADKERALIEYLEGLVSPGRFPRAKFYLSVYGAGVLFRRFSIPKLKNKNEERQAVVWEARKQIPFPLENAYWTYRTVEKQTDVKRKVEVIFAAILKSVLDRQTALFLQAGVPLSGVSLGAFGFAEVMPQTPREADEAVGVLEITPKSSYFSLFGKTGLELFREFKNLGLKPSDFEGQTLAESLAPLSGEVQSSLDFYQAQYSGRRLIRLFLAGLPGGDVAIPDHFEAALGSKVSVISPTRELSYAVGRAEEFAGLYPFFAKALGVALGRDRSFYLLPETVEKTYRLERANRLIWRGALVAAGLLGIFQGLYYYKLKSAETQLSRRQTELSRLEAVPGFAQAAVLQQKILSTQSFLSQFVRYPASYGWYLKELSNLVPPTVALDRITLLPVMTDSLSARQKHGVFDHLEISGAATAPYPEADAAVIEFIRRLEHSPFFGGVKIISKSEEKFGEWKTVGFSFEVGLR